jgi:hypothetical protein
MDNQMEMQVRVMALELAIKAKSETDSMASILDNAKTIITYIKGE